MKESEYRAAMLLECLGEPVRFQILRHLEKGPHAVSTLARLTKRHQVTVCHHLAILRTMHLVRYRNRGKFTYYELKLKIVPSLLNLGVQAAQLLHAGE